MKQLFTLLLAVLPGSLVIASRAENIDIELQFDEDDYQVVSANGIVSINSRHIEDIVLPNGPMLPMIKINLSIPSGMEFGSISLTADGITLIGDNIQIAASSDPIPTNMAWLEDYDSDLIPYADSDRISQFSYIGLTEYQEVSILYCAVSPFRYDYSTQTLYFYRNIEVSISLNEKKSLSETSPLSPLAYELWSDLVINPDELATMGAPLKPLYLDDDYQLVMDGDNSNDKTEF